MNCDWKSVFEECRCGYINKCAPKIRVLRKTLVRAVDTAVCAAQAALNTKCGFDESIKRYKEVLCLE